MASTDTTTGQLFRGSQVFSVLAQNPVTAKYLGQADVCRIIAELKSNPAAYSKYKYDARIVEIANQLASGGVSPSQMALARSEWLKSIDDNGEQGGGTESLWRSARRNNGGSTAASSSSGTFNTATFFAAVRSGSLSSVSSVVDSNPTALFQVPPCLLSGQMIANEDDFGYTPLHLAAQNGHAPIVNYLLSKGADVDQKQAAGYSPLHIAVLSDKTSVALSLIENGANVEMRDNEGNTALEYALRNDNPELISVLIEAAMGDESQRNQRERRRQENERKRQTASLALPTQVERKLVRGHRAKASRRPAPSLFDDYDDTPSLFGEDEPAPPTPRSPREEKGDLMDLFGFEDDEWEDDEEYVPKGKEAKPTPTKTASSGSGGGRRVSWAVEEKEDDGGATETHAMIGNLFADDDDDDDDDVSTSTSTSTSSSTSSTTTAWHPLVQQMAQCTSVSTSTSATSISVKADAQTIVVKTASASARSVSALPGEDERLQLLAQIQQLEAKLAEKDRELLAKDDKISILEEDTWCRICMDRKIETVLLWCGHNILRTPCSQKVQKSKKECPVCSKAVARVVRTYRA